MLPHPDTTVRLGRLRQELVLAEASWERRRRQAALARLFPGQDPTLRPRVEPRAWLTDFLRLAKAAISRRRGAPAGTGR